MEKGIRNFMAASALTTLALTGGPSRAADRQGPTVVVDLADLAGIGSEGLSRMKAQAERVFETAGVRVAWVDPWEGTGAGACEGFKVFVTLLPPEQVMKQRGREGALGQAVRADGQAWIYPSRIGLLGRRKGLDEGSLLGLVITHEVWHLLLPNARHSSEGIMTPRIDTDPRAFERARFTPQEASAIRARVESKADNSGERPTCGS